MGDGDVTMKPRVNILVNILHINGEVKAHHFHPL